MGGEKKNRCVVEGSIYIYIMVGREVRLLGESEKRGVAWRN